MNNSFLALKNNRQSAVSKLSSELSKLNSTTSSTGARNVDERFWTPTVDKTGNGSALIRFLPPPEGEDVPFVRIFSHAFQGTTTGIWYIENSLTTLGQDDPVGNLNRELWNSGSEANKEIVRKQKRKVQYISNIYVISDPGNPANNGKVFLFRYGKKLFDKWNDLMNPHFEGDEAINAFDLWSGANFRLRVRNFQGYRNYDQSDFDRKSALLDNDEALEAIWKQCHPLQAFLAADQFKTYDELEAKMNKVLGLDWPVTRLNVPASREDNDVVVTTNGKEEDIDLEALLKTIDF